MFNTLKNVKNRFKNSSTWGEFFASYLINLDDIYKQLEGKTETQQIEILKKALGGQQNKVQELVEELAKRNEEIEKLADENQKLKEQIESKQDLTVLKTKLLNLKNIIYQTSIEIQK